MSSLKHENKVYSLHAQSIVDSNALAELFAITIQCYLIHGHVKVPSSGNTGAHHHGKAGEHQHKQELQINSHQQLDSETGLGHPLALW